MKQVGPCSLVAMTHRRTGRTFLGLDFESPDEAGDFARALRDSDRVIVALLQHNRATICYVRGETRGKPTATAQLEVDDAGEIPWELLAGVICLASSPRWVSQPVEIDQLLTGHLVGLVGADLDVVFPRIAPALARVPRGKGLN